MDTPNLAAMRKQLQELNQVRSGKYSISQAMLIYIYASSTYVCSETNYLLARINISFACAAPQPSKAQWHFYVVPSYLPIGLID